MGTPLQTVTNFGGKDVAKYTYFETGDPFSEWHRKQKGIRQIDIDGCEICEHCYEPLALTENSYDIGQTFKAFWTTRLLALKANIPAYCILYKVDEATENRDVVSLRIKRVAPVVSKEYITIDPEDFRKELLKLHDKHRLICKVLNEWKSTEA